VSDPWPDDLERVLPRALDLLAAGARERRSGFHTGQLGTLCLDGGPMVRTVVLRDFDGGSWRARVHTDRRSPKVAEIAREPRVALHFYDPALAVQLRLQGQARVETEGPAADTAWAATRAFSRVCYRLDPAPGDAVSAPELGFPRRDASDPEDGRAAFAIVTIEVEAIDWLWLNHAGHRRARFGRDGRMGWLVP
jgi:pyridoxamine 5'-phosphate oxidase